MYDMTYTCHHLQLNEFEFGVALYTAVDIGEWTTPNFISSFFTQNFYNTIKNNLSLKHFSFGIINILDFTQ